MYKNGWTRETVMQRIRERNKGYPAMAHTSSQHKSCAYRGNNDNQCLMGCFIEDEDYSYRMEDNTIDEVVGDFGIKLPMNIKACGILQDFHDTYATSNGKGEKFYKAVESKLIELEKEY